MVSDIGIFSAAITIAAGAVSTAWSQGRIGEAVAGMLAERPENIGIGLILTVLPETGLVLSFVIAIILLFVV